MRRLAFAYGVLVSGVATVTMMYTVGFVGGFGVPKHVDTGTAGPPAVAVVVDLSLLALFAAQHSLMARPRVKRWSSRLIPPPVERSTYVLLSSATLALLFWQWRPLPAPVWDLAGPARPMVHGLFALGWLFLLVAAVAIGPLELLGIDRVRALLRGLDEHPARLRTPGPYALVRHPLMTGFLVAFWAAPTMTAGHLLLAVAMTAYILVAIRLEERDLGDLFGRRYDQYRAEVPAFVPFLRRRSGGDRAVPDPPKMTH